MNCYLCGCFLLTSQIVGVSAAEPTPPSQAALYPPISPRNGRSALPGADLTIDYLYWTARENGLEFAYDGVSTGPLDASAGHIYHPQATWTSGYRVGLAAYTAYDGWDLQALYTWYKLSTQGNVQSSGDLKPTWKISTIASLSHASNNWSLNFNTLDILLRRKFYLSPQFVVQPAVGLKFALQKQVYMVTYDTQGSSVSGTMHITQKNEAAGLSAGIATNWYITNPVSLCGRLAASTLWFKANPHRIDTYESSSSFYKALNTQETISYAAPVLETFLGLSFESSLYKKKIQAIFQLGYEFQIWFDINQFQRTILDANGSLGDLNIQGLTLRGQLEF